MRVLLKNNFLLPAICIHLFGCGGSSDANTAPESSITSTTSAVTTSIGASSFSLSVENSAIDCDVAATKAFSDLPEISQLPNPFIFADGTPVMTKQQWVCRRAEIAAQAQAYELGKKPRAP